MVGKRLACALREDGVTVIPVSRKPEPDGVIWDIESMMVEPRSLLDGASAWVHLAGEPIIGRWTAARKRSIRASRVQGTRLLAQIADELQQPPPVCIAASAIGYYGPKTDKGVDEAAAPGNGFLANVCQAWEAAAQPMTQAGIRVVNLRIGVVLAPEGGALGQMLPLFKAGMGGVVGKGDQHLSWIAIDDLVHAIRFCLDCETIRGPVNAVAPHPVTNREFSRTLAALLGRPALLPVPALALRFAYGEMAGETLLADQQVSPKSLLAAGFNFRHEDLKGALTSMLG